MKKSRLVSAAILLQTSIRAERVERENKRIRNLFHHSKIKNKTL